MRQNFSLRWMVLLACVVSAPASEEVFLEWGSVVLKCLEEKTPAGAVSCEITRGSAGYSRFVIRAFGKEHILSEPQLARLKDFPLSSLQTRHEAGYEKIGGHTVHFYFERTFYNAEKKLVTEVLYVSVNKKGLALSEPRQK